MSKTAVPEPWTCPHCRTEQANKPEAWCPDCYAPCYQSWAIQVAQHVTEHLADGLSEPLVVLEAMQSRPCYQRSRFTLPFIAQQMRLLTKDTSTLARQIAKARSSRTMLEVLETGDTKDKIAVLKGIQVLGDVVEHKGEVATVVRHIYEGGEPPKP
jgi:hypothetical protein